jgi:2-hydroxychromene-2-carboxylate isomerase
MMQTLPPIDFYFDFSSPYGYFMSEKIDALASQHGRSVSWRPILLFAVLRALGLPPPFEHPVKLEYITADFARSAKFLDLEYRMPEAFPAMTQHAARAFYLLQEQAPAAAVPFARAVLRGYWRQARDISDINVIAQMVGEAGAGLGPAAAVREQLKTDAARARLQDAISAAVTKKVFGSPFVIVDGEPFFGVDRLPQIAASLAARNTA